MSKDKPIEAQQETGRNEKGQFEVGRQIRTPC